MKIVFSAACAALAVFVTSCASTGNRGQGSQAQTQSEPVLLTGSYIKAPVNRSGMVTDASSEVLVIDRSMIETSGASDVKEVLNRRGIH